jgi:O-antigen/teichoic acid export membrane protein
LVGNSVAQVFYPRFNRQMQAGAPLLPLFLQAIGALALIGLPIFTAMAVLGPWAFSLAFGGEWVQAGHYARWLSLWLFFMLVNRACNDRFSLRAYWRSLFASPGYGLVGVFSPTIYGQLRCSVPVE